MSEAGWEHMAGYPRANVAELVRRRDLGSRLGRPLFLHTYAVPKVRPPGTVGRPQGQRFPAQRAYAVLPSLR